MKKALITGVTVNSDSLNDHAPLNTLVQMNSTKGTRQIVTLLLLTLFRAISAPKHSDRNHHPNRLIQNGAGASVLFA